jgi:hypothetical protein
MQGNCLQKCLRELRQFPGAKTPDAHPAIECRFFQLDRAQHAD